MINKRSIQNDQTTSAAVLNVEFQLFGIFDTGKTILWVRVRVGVRVVVRVRVRVAF